jgi:Zn-finger nucleic acid-binding protein
MAFLHGSPTNGEQSSMQCPKCEGAMEQVKYQRVSIDRCVNCKGIWFKPESLTRLKDMWMSEFLDKGDPAVGRLYNQREDVCCPECGKKMDKEIDEKQTHIWYESCPDGHGVYFDAGEFTDWKYDTLMDRFRDFFSKTRK